MADGGAGDYDGEERKGHLRSAPFAVLLQTHSTSAAPDLLPGTLFKNIQKNLKKNVPGFIIKRK